MRNLLGGDAVEYRFDVVLESLHGLQHKADSTFVIKWKRGDKRSGTTHEAPSSSRGMSLFNYNFIITGTMMSKEKSRFHRKLLEFVVEELSYVKEKEERKRIGEMKLDLADYLDCRKKSVVARDKKGGPCSLMLSITSEPFESHFRETVSESGLRRANSRSSYSDAGISGADSDCNAQSFGQFSPTSMTNMSVDCESLSPIPIDEKYEELQKKLQEQANINRLNSARLIELEKKLVTSPEAKEIRRLSTPILNKSKSINTELNITRDELIKKEFQVKDLSKQLEESASRAAEIISLQNTISKLQNTIQEMEVAMAKATTEQNQYKCEMHIIDALVLWISPPLFEGTIPVHPLMMGRLMMEWDSFEGDYNPEGVHNTFLNNVTAAIRHMVKIHTRSQDPSSSCYWLSYLYWFLCFLDQQFPMFSIRLKLSSKVGLLDIRAALCRDNQHKLLYPESSGPEFKYPSLPPNNNCPVLPLIQPEIEIPAPEYGRSVTEYSHEWTQSAVIVSSSQELKEMVVLRFTKELLIETIKVQFAIMRNFITFLDQIAVDAVFGNFLPISARLKSSSERGGDLIQIHFNKLHDAMVNNYLPLVFQNMILKCGLSHLNSILFNCILEQPSLCCMSAALHLKMVITQLTTWIHSKKIHSSCAESLSHVLQVSDILILHKELLTSKEERTKVCPLIRIHQLMVLLHQYTPDELDPQGVSPEVLESLEEEAHTTRNREALTLGSQYDKLTSYMDNTSSLDSMEYISDWIEGIGQGTPLDLINLTVPAGLVNGADEFPQLMKLLQPQF